MGRNRRELKFENFTVICAWCDRVLSKKVIPEARRTHTICEACFERMRRDIHNVKSRGDALQTVSHDQ